MKIAFIVQRYGTEILGGSEYHCRLIAERLAAAARGRGADDLRARLHHLEERVPGGHRPRPRRHRPPLRERADARHRTRSTATPTGSSTTRTRRDDEMEWLKQQGPWCPALLEYLERNHQQYDVADLLHLPLRADRAGLQIAPRKSILVPTAHDEPAIHLGHLQGACSACPAALALQHRGRAAVPDDALPDPRGRGGDDRLRRRPAAGTGVPARADAPTRTPPRREPTPRPATVRRSPPLPPHLAHARRGLPPAPSAARPVRALRRPHRSRQGLRGADRVLQHAT